MDFLMNSVAFIGWSGATLSTYVQRLFFVQCHTCICRIHYTHITPIFHRLVWNYTYYSDTGYRKCRFWLDENDLKEYKTSMSTCTTVSL